MKDPGDHDVAIFTEALRLPVGERAAFLKSACGNDTRLLQRLEALIETHDCIGDFLESPAESQAAMEESTPHAGEKPGERIGRYRLLQQLGEGGCGVVFLAEQEDPIRRRVALKVIKPGMDTKGVVARFELERQALALMDHPNIAKAFDAGATTAGRPYFVMELVRGVKITEYCDKHSLSVEGRLKLFIQVAQAVQHAHQKGIIHRDIKPSNILVTTTLEGTALPVVIDFGIAKATANQRLTENTFFTAFEMLVGTPAYMSPEQAELTSVDVDTRTDIYSLGVLLYELLTGSTPFDAGELSRSGIDEIRRVIREQDPGRPSQRLARMSDGDLEVVASRRSTERTALIRKLRGDLDWIVVKALEKDRKRRYPTAHSLAADVQRSLAEEPVLARPPSLLYKLKKSARRNRLLFAGTGTIAVLLVVGLIVVSASFANERRSRREAETASLKSQQVTQFLETMLDGVGPSVALGRDTTMLREILDRTSDRVGKEMTNQPAVEADLRNLIGKLYAQTGNYYQAERMHRAALTLNRKLFGIESTQAATSLNNLGLSLMVQDKLAEAQEAYSEALAIRRRLFGKDHADTATSLNDLSCVYRQRGKSAEAEAMAREALAVRQKLFGEEHLEVADSLRNLSIILGNQRRWAESEAVAREVLAMRRRLLAPDHPWVAASLNDVAWAAGGNGKLNEAESLEREALAMRQKLLGATHPDVAKSLYLVGERARQRGHLNEAYSILSAALSIQRKLLGEENTASLDTLKSLGLTLKGEGKLSDAETIYRELLAYWRKRVGNTEPQSLYALRDLGAILEAEAKWDEAESARREELAAWRERSGDSDGQTLYAMHLLGITLQNQGKWGQAEAVLKESVAGWRKRAGNADPQTLYALRDLATALEGGNKWAEAEVAHREALASWRNRAGNEDPQTVYTLDRLGSTLEHQGKWSDAEIVYRETLMIRRKQSGNEDSSTLTEWENLFRVLTEQKKFGDAERLLDEVLTPAFSKQPASASLLALRVGIKARRGQWQGAADDASLALEYQPGSPRYAMVAALLLKSRNLPAYERLCKRLMGAFSQTTDAYFADQVAKSCLFLPSSGVDLQLVSRLADTAVKNGAGDPRALPFYQDCKALAEYRMGRFAEAVSWAQKPLGVPGLFVHGHTYATLAMAYWKLGDKEKARASLAKGEALAPIIMPVSVAEDPSHAWLAWLFARLQIDEAADLMTPKSTAERGGREP